MQASQSPGSDALLSWGRDMGQRGAGRGWRIPDQRRAGTAERHGVNSVRRRMRDPVEEFHRERASEGDCVEVLKHIRRLRDSGRRGISRQCLTSGLKLARTQIGGWSKASRAGMNVPGESLPVHGKSVSGFRHRPSSA